MIGRHLLDPRWVASTLAVQSPVECARFRRSPLLETGGCSHDTLSLKAAQESLCCYLSRELGPRLRSIGRSAATSDVAVALELQNGSFEIMDTVISKIELALCTRFRCPSTSQPRLAPLRFPERARSLTVTQDLRGVTANCLGKLVLVCRAPTAWSQQQRSP